VNWWIWGAAALAYGLFLAWYQNWRGPLRRDEIESYLAKVQGTPTAEHNDLAVLREFLENDDGGEFVMLNIVRVAPGEAAHPVSGAPTRAADLLQAYTRAFLPELLRRGGHPAIVSRKIGGYVDAWRVEPDPGWTIMGYMRYRSRRDMMDLVVDPRFVAMHPFKMAGTAETFSFPTRPMMMMFVGPRVWLALSIALAAALAQIAVLLQQ
jgi:hypothetical protein